MFYCEYEIGEKEMIYTSYFEMAHKIEDKDRFLSIAL